MSRREAPCSRRLTTGTLSIMAGGAQAIGQQRRRSEDHRLLIGAGGYVDDLISRLAGVVHVAFVRSPFPSARIRDLDSSLAAAARGVVGIVHGGDQAELGSLPLPGAPFLPGFPPAPPHPILASDMVRFVGEPIVAIVADSVAHAEDARDQVQVDYEPLPAVADLGAALRPDAPLVHAGF